jgi:hypothetical protein
MQPAIEHSVWRLGLKAGGQQEARLFYEMFGPAVGPLRVAGVSVPRVKWPGGELDR